MGAKGLNGNQLKFIAIIAMTLDHIVGILYPDYPTTWWIVGCHIIGRLTAPMQTDRPDNVVLYRGGLLLYAHC